MTVAAYTLGPPIMCGSRSFKKYVVEHKITAWWLCSFSLVFGLMAITYEELGLRM